jgi:hypothetical protein
MNPDLQRDGVAILPAFIDAATGARLRAVCDEALATWRAGLGGRDTTNLAYLTDPKWYGGRPGPARELIEWIASPPLVAAMTEVAGERYVLHNTQYFPEPLARSWIGDWHRDCQFIARDPDDERAIRAENHGWHLRVALVDDDHLEYVPGSERRDDDAAEADARARRVGVDLPTARRIALRAGDAAVFSAWGVHRGRYLAGRERRTLDVIFNGRRAERLTADCFPPAMAAAGLSEPARTLLARSGLLAAGC